MVTLTHEWQTRVFPKLCHLIFQDSEKDTMASLWNLRYHTEITDTWNELLTSVVDKCWKASEYKTRLVQCDFFRVVPLCWTMTVHFHTNRCDIRHHRCVCMVPHLAGDPRKKKDFLLAESSWATVVYETFQRQAPAQTADERDWQVSC